MRAVLGPRGRRLVRQAGGSWQEPLEIDRRTSYGISAAVGGDGRLQVFTWSPIARRLERFTFCSSHR